MKTFIYLNDYFTMMSHPVMVRYPSGIQFRNGLPFVLGFAATSSDLNFELDSKLVDQYTKEGVWNYFVPGLFKYRSPFEDSFMAEYGNPEAGTPGKPPALVDGKGQQAGFVAPHDLEDSGGLFYLIDDGRIRTIDAENNVKTLDLPSVGITNRVKALDADHAGRIHALTNTGFYSYTWHRLADGKKVDFGLVDYTFPGVPKTIETFTVVGDDIVLAMRDWMATESILYRVTSSGVVTRLTGTATAATPGDFLNEPSKYRLPTVQHLKYGVDGHLYIVLPQGVLIARDFNFK